MHTQASTLTPSGFPGRLRACKDERVGSVNKRPGWVGAGPFSALPCTLSAQASHNSPVLELAVHPRSPWRLLRVTNA